MTIEANDIIDWAAMDTPPTFHTALHEVTERDGKEVSETSVVITFASDFPAIAAGWATASPKVRAATFWQVGAVHTCEVEVMRLPLAKGRAEAIDTPGVVGPSDDDPIARGKRLFRVVRETRMRHGMDPLPMKLTGGPAYIKLLAVRASGPYCGSHNVNVVVLHTGHFGTAEAMQSASQILGSTASPRPTGP